MRVMECINIRPSQIGTEKKGNCRFTNVQVLNLLMLFPFFVVRNAYRYSGSSLSRLFCCEKDMFYRPKSGRKSELIGKIFSHLEHKSILGYKCLTLLLSDGLSQLFLDFSIHGEEGRKPGKRQGLTDKQRSERFSADYTGQSVEERVREYTMKKTDKAIEMVKYAIKRGIRFDYLLIDSWFTSTAFVRLITSRHIKCHLIGMVKLGKTKYHTKWGDLTANQIIEKLQKQGLTKHNRTLKCTYCAIDVKFAGTTVRQFFSKRGRKGQWNGLLTTDLSLSFLKAYRTYAMRWTTEVAYHDCKQLLDFGRFEAYETIGALFRETTGNTLELSAADRIWELILDTILEIAEIISADASELLSVVIDGNSKFHKLYQMYKLVA